MRGILTVMVVLTLVGAAGAADFPEEGVVVGAGEQLAVLLGSVRVRTLPNQVLTPMPDFDEEIKAGKRKPGHVQAERQRRHLRMKELKAIRGGAIGKGVLTEVLYKKGRKSAEKSKASSQRGQGSNSILKKLLGS